MKGAKEAEGIVGRKTNGVQIVTAFIVNNNNNDNNINSESLITIIT